MSVRNTLVPVVLSLLISVVSASAENWVSPTDMFWVDLDSLRQDSNGYLIFKLLWGETPQRPMHGNLIGALNCSNKSFYEYQDDKWVEQATSDEFNNAFARTLCRRR